jgi:hypothetical protein
MASTFPTTLDSFPTTRADATVSATNHAADHDNNADAINKIEALLGTNPKTAPGAANRVLRSTSATAADWDAVQAADLAQLKWARVYHNAAQSLTSGVVAALAFNSERFDTDAIHDTVTNNSRLTCKTAGVYVATVCASFAANATGQRALGIRLNGATELAWSEVPATAAEHTTLVTSTIYVLAVNDYLEALGYQTSGGALNVESIANYTPEFTMARLGTS